MGTEDRIAKLKERQAARQAQREQFKKGYDMRRTRWVPPRDALLQKAPAGPKGDNAKDIEWVRRQRRIEATEGRE
jgi:hypothetical protein